MEPSTPILNLAPLLDYGFAGFALIQFAAGVWICLKGLVVLSSVRDVVAANTAALVVMDRSLADNAAIVQGCKEELLRRPCQMTRDQLCEFLRRLQPSA